MSARYQVSVVLAAVDEMSPALDRAKQGMDRIGTAANENSTRLSRLGQSIQSDLMGALTVFSLAKGVEIIGQINELGMSVTKARNTFEQLTGGAEAAASTLVLLQESTLGTADNLVLMEGANQLLMMGLASTNEEAVELIGMAVKLGAAMGKDAGTAINDFGLMLANQSVERLDTFGLSSGRVRQRIEELLASGQALARDEAFRMAVLEMGEVALDRLGASVEKNATTFERWGVRIQNVAQDVAANVTAGIEGLAGIVEVSLGLHPDQQANVAQLEDAALKFADDYWEIITEILVERDIPEASRPTFVKDFLAEAFRLAKENPDWDWSDITVTALNNMGEAMAALDARTVDIMARFGERAFITAGDRAEEAAAEAAERATVAYVQGLAGALGGAGNTLVAMGNKTWALLAEGAEKYIGESVARMQALGAEVTAVGNALIDRANTVADALLAAGARNQALGQYAEFLTGGAGAIGSSLEVAFGFRPGALGGGLIDMLTSGETLWEFPDMPDFMTGDQAAFITDQYRLMATELERMRALAEQGLITDEELDKAAVMTENLRLMSEEANAAAEALKNIKLSDVLGTTAGGLSGELTDMLMGQLQESGMSETALAETQQLLDLQSGRETEASVVLRETVMPFIASLAELDPTLAATAVENVKGFMEQAALMGLTPAQVAAGLPTATGFRADGTAIAGYNAQGAALLAAGQGPAILQGGAQALANIAGLPGLPGMLGLGGGGILGGFAGLAGGTTEAGAVGLGLGLGVAGGAGVPGQMGLVGEGTTALVESARELDTLMASVESSLQQAVLHLQRMKQQIESVEGRYRVIIDIVANDPAGALRFASIENTVRGNGGVVPGRDARGER